MAKPLRTEKRIVRGAARGYTVVEIMSAMTLFAIGAAGVVGMQRVTVQGGYDARRFDTATNIAREWQHRLQRDSAYWTEPNSINQANINAAHAPTRTAAHRYLTGVRHPRP
jgi:prepilin-type N-terminal cleavage/methylation domain-containing protein